MREELYKIQYRDVKTNVRQFIKKFFSLSQAARFYRHVELWDGVDDVKIITNKGCTLDIEEVEAWLLNADNQKGQPFVPKTIKLDVFKEKVESKKEVKKRERFEMKCPQCGSREVMKIKKGLIKTKNGATEYRCLDIDCWHKFEYKKTEDILVFTKGYALA